MLWSLVATLLLAGTSSAAANPQRWLHDKANCKCFPGDACWPRPDEWSRLNKTVDGRLIATVPLGSPCHDPSYEEAQCARLQKEWLYSSVQ